MSRHRVSQRLTAEVAWCDPARLLREMYHPVTLFARRGGSCGGASAVGLVRRG